MSRHDTLGQTPADVPEGDAPGWPDGADATDTKSGPPQPYTGSLWEAGDKFGLWESLAESFLHGHNLVAAFVIGVAGFFFVQDNASDPINSLQELGWVLLKSVAFLAFSATVAGLTKYANRRWPPKRRRFR